MNGSSVWLLAGWSAVGASKCTSWRALLLQTSLDHLCRQPYLLLLLLL
jgi:hypothetical protein